ncbi:cobalamin biosynthesis protein CobG [Novosphingobium sp. BL-8A]
MTDFSVRGWCPSAWRPMMAGDGLILRVKPRLSRLSGAEIILLCELAGRFGNGVVDLTNRANLQIRGVPESGWQPLLEGLLAAGLVDEDPLIEQRRNVLVAPDWASADDTWRIASELTARLSEFPELQGKFGFVVDAGGSPVLGASPGDLRIERAVDDTLLLRLDGREFGVAVAVSQAVDAMLDLARWFVASGGTGRAARHEAPLPEWAAGDRRPGPTRAPLDPGMHPLGRVWGIPFGSIDAAALIDLVRRSGASALRLTPWRMIVLEDAEAVIAPAFIDNADDPLLRVDACPGAPACPQAGVETRGLARRLAPHLPGRLHVSGCSKRCARGAPADVVLTGRDGRFDLAFDACAGDPAVRSALDPSQLLAHFGAE